MACMMLCFKRYWAAQEIKNSNLCAHFQPSRQEISPGCMKQLHSLMTMFMTKKQDVTLTYGTILKLV